MFDYLYNVFALNHFQTTNSEYFFSIDEALTSQILTTLGFKMLWLSSSSSSSDSDSDNDSV